MEDIIFICSVIISMILAGVLLVRFIKTHNYFIRGRDARKRKTQIFLFALVPLFICQEISMSEELGKLIFGNGHIITLLAAIGFMAAVQDLFRSNGKKILLFMGCITYYYHMGRCVFIFFTDYY